MKSLHCSGILQNECVAKSSSRSCKGQQGKSKLFALHVCYLQQKLPTAPPEHLGVFGQSAAAVVKRGYRARRLARSVLLKVQAHVHTSISTNNSNKPNQPVLPSSSKVTIDDFSSEVLAAELQQLLAASSLVTVIINILVIIINIIDDLQTTPCRAVHRSSSTALLCIYYTTKYKYCTTTQYSIGQRITRPAADQQLLLLLLVFAL